MLAVAIASQYHPRSLGDQLPVELSNDDIRYHDVQRKAVFQATSRVNCYKEELYLDQHLLLWPVSP